jgi:hypothetical protein
MSRAPTRLQMVYIDVKKTILYRDRTQIDTPIKDPLDQKKSPIPDTTAAILQQKAHSFCLFMIPQRYRS